MTMQRIRDYYGVPAKRGGRVEFRGQPGVIIDKAAILEETLTSTRAARGKGPVFLSAAGIPLRSAIGTDQPLLDDGCDSGWCHT